MGRGPKFKRRRLLDRPLPAILNCGEGGFIDVRKIRDSFGSRREAKEYVDALIEKFEQKGDTDAATRDNS